MLDRARVREVYAEAAALPEGERAAFLDGQCAGDEALRAEVESLLTAAAGRPGFLESPTAAPPPGPGAPGEGPGTRIGPYRLLQAIGEGGFGAVYMAEQEEPVRRRVALKVIKLGMDTRGVLARFEAERQALAMMDHAHIARVLDAGATATGRPYFVMELVNGEPITAYCDGRNLNIPERLDLFVQVCHAVQHAHSKGVIHRDLKPSNVLVATEDGRPHAKVIDFGIAKATEHRLTAKTLFTELRQLIGTPEYMSPEQAEGSLDVDTRSDVYSLGVLLYQLLTGATPFDPQALRSAAYAEIQRIIREVEPPKPSTRLSRSGTLAAVAVHRRTEPGRLSALVRGDLDWIVMKALDKDRARRYDTASALAADIARHVVGEPVTAAPPSRSYRVRKFVRRNRGLVVGAALVGAALVLGVIGTSIGLIRANAAREDEKKQRTAAQESAQRAEETKRFITSMLEAAAPAVARGEDTALMRRILGEAATRLDAGEVKNPLIEAELRHTIGTAYERLGEPDAAQPMLLRALELRTAALGAGASDTLASLEQLGNVYKQAGRLSDSETALNKAVAGMRATLGDRDPRTLDALNSLGTTLERQGRYADAESCFREALDGLTAAAGPEDQRTLAAMYNLGFALSARGRYAEAEPHMRAALEARRRTLGDDAPDTLANLSALGILVMTTGRIKEAEALLREALDGYRRVVGADHPDTLAIVNNMGGLMMTTGRPAEAEAYFREALDGFRRRFGDEHPNTLNAIQNMAAPALALGRPEEAETWLRQAVEGMRRSPAMGPSNARTYTAIAAYAHALRVGGQLQQAESLAREAHSGLARLLDPGHPSILPAAYTLGAILHATGRLDEAEPLLREAAQGRSKALGPGHPRTLEAAAAHALLLSDMGRFADAERSLLDALDAARPTAGEPRVLVDALARVYDRWHGAEPGAGHDVQARQWRDKLNPPVEPAPPAEPPR